MRLHGVLRGPMPGRSHKFNDEHHRNHTSVACLHAGSVQGVGYRSRVDPAQFSISVFKNRDMLTNLRRSPHILRAITNGGHQDSHMVGDFPNLGQVWYNPKSIANILSLADVSKVCRVTMDTTEERAMCVHRLDGSLMKFVEHPSGLYVFSGKGSSKDKIIVLFSMLTIVTKQKKLFPAGRSRPPTPLALSTQARPSCRGRYHALLRRQYFRNRPVIADDAQRALTIYGLDVATLKGK